MSEVKYKGKLVVLKEFSFAEEQNKPPDWFMKEVTIQRFVHLPSISHSLSSLVGKHPNTCTIYGAFHGIHAADGKFKAALLLERFSRKSLATVMTEREKVEEDVSSSCRILF